MTRLAGRETLSGEAGDMRDDRLQEIRTFRPITAG
jgi:hypothetical protein